MVDFLNQLVSASLPGDRGPLGGWPLAHAPLGARWPRIPHEHGGSPWRSALCAGHHGLKTPSGARLGCRPLTAKACSESMWLPSPPGLWL